MKYDNYFHIAESKNDQRKFNEQKVDIAFLDTSRFKVALMTSRQLLDLQIEIYLNLSTICYQSRRNVEHMITI